jgi:hypothetical protein
MSKSIIDIELRPPFLGGILARSICLWKGFLFEYFKRVLENTGGRNVFRSPFKRPGDERRVRVLTRKGLNSKITYAQKLLRIWGLWANNTEAWCYITSNNLKTLEAKPGFIVNCVNVLWFSFSDKEALQHTTVFDWCDDRAANSAGKRGLKALFHSSQNRLTQPAASTCI